MGPVVNLGDYRPHSAGKAVCLGCEHEWVSVAPIGCIHLDCPKCERAQGVWKHGFEPQDGESFWRCNCGGTLFYLQPNRVIRCRACGQRVEGYE
jgi:ribosomal protein S27E